MTDKFWAKRKSKQIGPFTTRDEALSSFREQFPHKGADYLARAKPNQILVARGEFGPHFDMQWHDAK